MKPNNIINILADAKGARGNLWFTEPMTNIPIGERDTYAGKFMKAMVKIMPKNSTVQDYINVFMEVFWWLIFFPTANNDDSFKERGIK
jgi:hypothetical protein